MSYENGAIWIDTVGGSAGTVVNTNGIATNPVDSIGDALTLAASSKLRRFEIVNGSYLQLDATVSYIDFRGNGSVARVNTSAQQLNNCSFRDVQVFGGCSTGSVGPVFNFCLLGTGTMPTFRADQCRLNGTITLTDHALLSNCVELWNNSSKPAFDFDTPESSLYVVCSNYTGRLETQGMNANASLILSGQGQLTINADCTAGTIVLMGLWDVVDNSSGAVTVSTFVDESISQIVNIGGGSYSVTITVDDGTDPLEGAVVRMYRNVANDYRSTTGADGVTDPAFSLDAARYTVSITLAGYTFAPVTLEVSADASQTYSMTAVIISASDPGKTTGYLTVIGQDGNVAANTNVSIRPFVPSASTGLALVGTVRTEQSNVSGVVQFTNLLKGGKYQLKKGNSNKWETVDISADAGDEVALDSLILDP